MANNKLPIQYGLETNVLLAGGKPSIRITENDTMYHEVGGVVKPLNQSDWNESSAQSPRYIRNKPTVLNGNDGWTPVFSAVTDGERIVQQITDWVGGSGTKPTVGQYVGSTGLVSNIASAVNIRGAKGVDGTQGIDGTQGPAGPNTVSTSTTSNITGILKGNGSTVLQAVAGTDYSEAPVVGSSTFNTTTGRSITHNIGNINYRVTITPTGSAAGTLGEFYVTKATNTVTVYNTGSFTGGFDYAIFKQ